MKMRAKLPALFLAGALFSLLPAGPALGETFEELAGEARPVDNPAALVALFWSLGESCKEKNDFHRRQCEVVRRARREQVTGQTFLMRGAAAVTAGAYHEKKRSTPLKVSACVACDPELEAGGGRLWVIGKGPHRFAGGEVLAAEVHETSRTFESAKAAEAWKTHALPRLRADYVIRLSDKAERFSVKGGGGYKVEVLGFRVYDPCRGTVIAARPESGRLPADESTCGDEPEPEPERTESDGPKGPEIPAELTPGDVKRAMKKVTPKAQECFEAYRVPGTARFRITISGEGKVISYEQRGDFTDTPTGACLDELIEAATFPKSQKPETKIDYPIMLR